METPQYELHLHLSAGELHVAAGRPAEAKAPFGMALELCREHGFRSEEIEARAVLAKVDGDLGEPVSAMRQIRTLLAEIDAETDPPLHSRLDVLDHASVIALRVSDFAAARTFAGEAYDGFAFMENPQRRARSLLILARAEAGLGAVSIAREHVEQVLRVLADLRELPEYVEARALSRELDAAA
ncbi:hypothetical protein GCM10029992_12990 [Glycomyces albus]